jgi:hypothetical protein
MLRFVLAVLMLLVPMVAWADTPLGPDWQKIPGGVAQPGCLVTPLSNACMGDGSINAHSLYVDGAPVAGGGMSVASVTLTSEQILGSWTTPVELVPGVPGKTIFVFGADFLYHYATANYVGSFPVVVYHGDVKATTNALALSGSDWNGLSDARVWAQSSNIGPNVSPLTDRVGLGVDFTTTDADPVGGDSTMTVTVFYTTF